MMRTEWRYRPLVLFFSLVFAASCSRDSFEARVKELPRRFQVNGTGYIISEQEPGVIDDNAIAYTADAGARTFNFNTRTVLRHLYVGRWESFDSLPQDERREVKDLANGALGYIHGLERRQRRLSEVDQRHREILRAFLAGQVPQAAAAMAENTKSCSCSAGSLPRLSAAETARELVERRWPTPPLGARIQGDALFEVVVSSDGNVCCVTAISGHPLLVVGLASAIGKWRFNPGKSFIGVIATRYSSAGYQLLG